MTVEQLLSQVKVNNKSIPFAHVKFVKAADTYMVYTLMQEYAVLNGDDLPQASSVEIDIDIYTKSGDMSAIINSVRALFCKDGWIWIEDSPEMYDEKTKLFHRTITFEKERNILWQQSE